MYLQTVNMLAEIGSLGFVGVVISALLNRAALGDTVGGTWARRIWKNSKWTILLDTQSNLQIQHLLTKHLAYFCTYSLKMDDDDDSQATVPCDWEPDFTLLPPQHPPIELLILLPPTHRPTNRSTDAWVDQLHTHTCDKRCKVQVKQPVDKLTNRQTNQLLTNKPANANNRPDDSSHSRPTKRLRISSYSSTEDDS